MDSGGADGLAVKVEPAQAPRAVPDGVVAVEMAAHEHVEAGTGAAAGLFRQLERDETGGDDVIAGDDTLVLDAQDLLEIDAPQGDKGRARIGGRANSASKAARKWVRRYRLAAVVTPATRSSLTSRSCKVRLTRSLRPRAWGE